MKNVKKSVIALLLLMLITGSLSSCAKSDKYPDYTPVSSDNSEEKDNRKIAGTITMAGSTSMEKMANALSEAFMEKYPDVLVSAEFIGSGAGIEAMLSGTVNIGNSSRHLKETEISNGAVENIVAIDGIAVILDKANSISDISKDQLMKIFTGEINNWSEIGGGNQPIVVIGREAGSGTRDAFEELLGIEDNCKYSNEINSTGGVMAKVSSTPGAVGYVSLDVLDDTVNVSKIDGVEPSEEMIKAGSYLLSRPFIMTTKGDISDQPLEVQAFFEFIRSEEGKELIQRIGLINVE